MADAFTKASGIKTSFVRMSSVKAVARLDAAKSKPEFDVLYGGPSDGHVAADNAGLIEPYVSPNAAAIPDKYKDSRRHVDRRLRRCPRLLLQQGPAREDRRRAPRLVGRPARPQAQEAGRHRAPVDLGHVLHRRVDADGPHRHGRGPRPSTTSCKLHPERPAVHEDRLGARPDGRARRGRRRRDLQPRLRQDQKEGFDMLEVTFPDRGHRLRDRRRRARQGRPQRRNAKKFIDWTLTADPRTSARPSAPSRSRRNPDAKVTEDMVKLDRSSSSSTTRSPPARRRRS